ncbi:hypothetical protein E4U11_004377 [Claviceps purpurea]|nr:hypothetical protein E4U11_004377 [Claviceps purpurea]
MAEMTSMAKEARRLQQVKAEEAQQVEDLRIYKSQLSALHTGQWSDSRGSKCPVDGKWDNKCDYSQTPI